MTRSVINGRFVMTPDVIRPEKACPFQPQGVLMRVFITGASGHLGSVVVPELLGADVHRGSLDDLDSLRKAAGASDGVIHLAFMHDELNAGDLEGPLSADLSAIEAMGEVLAGSGKPFVGTSGTIPLAFGGV